MKRSALASAAALAVLALSACTGGDGTATPSPNPTPATIPTALPTPTATASVTPAPVSTGKTTTPKAPPKRTAAPHTPRATPTDDSEIAGAMGTIPEGFVLPEEDRAADEETSAFTTTIWRAACPDKVLTLASASGITATNIKESVGPEHVIGNGLMVFADAAAAEAFVTELSTQLAACTAEGPNEDGWRTVQKSEELAGFGDGGVQVRQWTQWDSEGTWVEAPGSALQYLARSGQYVVLTYEAGEYQGDPATLSGVVTDAESRLDSMLAQL